MSTSAGSPAPPAPPSLTFEQFDITAEDPWATYSWNYTDIPTPDRKTAPKKKGHDGNRLDSEQLTLFEHILPKFYDKCDKKKDTKEWKRKAVAGLFKHPAFSRLLVPKEGTVWSEHEKTAEFDRWRDLLVKRFENLKHREWKKGKHVKVADKGTTEANTHSSSSSSNAEGSVATPKPLDSTDSALLSRLLRHPGLMSGQELFQKKNHDAISAEGVKLRDQVKDGNAGAAFNKALANMWAELSDQERQAYEDEARDLRGDIFQHQDVLPALLHGLLQKVAALVGPSSFTLVMGWKDKRTKTVSCILDVSRPDTKEKLSKVILPNDVEKLIEEFFVKNHPNKPKPKPKTTIPRNKGGTPTFPPLNINSIAPVQLTAVLTDYLLVLWDHALETAGHCSDVPLDFVELCAMPELYYDTKKWSAFKGMLGEPSTMTLPQIYQVVAQLQASSGPSNEDPFVLASLLKMDPTPEPNLEEDSSKTTAPMSPVIPPPTHSTPPRTPNTTTSPMSPVIPLPTHSTPPRTPNRATPPIHSSTPKTTKQSTPTPVAPPPLGGLDDSSEDEDSDDEDDSGDEEDDSDDGKDDSNDEEEGSDDEEAEPSNCQPTDSTSMFTDLADLDSEWASSMGQQAVNIQPKSKAGHTTAVASSGNVVAGEILGDVVMEEPEEKEPNDKTNDVVEEDMQSVGEAKEQKKGTKKGPKKSKGRREQKQTGKRKGTAKAVDAETAEAEAKEPKQKAKRKGTTKAQVGTDDSVAVRPTTRRARGDNDQAGNEGPRRTTRESKKRSRPDEGIATPKKKPRQVDLHCLRTDTDF
ncbi:hypothetical protein BDZ89DRAFT_1130279 [Hymenopellis radicata]|nr:hypothetical protein BDZ89DRAFT_1130279 [Hymenopellis radicata]